MKRAFVLSIVVLLFLTISFSEVAEARASCSSMSGLAMQNDHASTGTFNVNGTTCFQLTGVSTSALLLTLKLTVSGAVDIYWSPGSTQNFSNRNKLNLSDFITQRTTYAFRNPTTGVYTVALVSNGSSSVGIDFASRRPSSSTSSPTVCNGDVCRSSYPLTIAQSEGAIIGSDFGDRAIFPFEAGCSGHIHATALWTGSAQNLALILNGEKQVSYFARVDGTSPLTIDYDVSADDVSNGGRWQLSLVNFSSGEADGNVDFDYPLCNNANALAYGPYTCQYGYVWREAGPHDYVCVTGDIRSQAAYDNSQAQSRVDPNGAYGPNSCVNGYVWREAFPGDYTCVTGDIRDQAHVDNSAVFERYILNFPYGPDTCVNGYVWREAAYWDHVCVTGDVRDQAAYDNSQAQSRVDPNGAYGPYSCVQGYVWREAFDGDYVCVTGDQRDQAASDNSQAEARYQRNQ